MLRFVVAEAEAELRLDMALSALAGISRSQARRWIDGGRVRLNERGCRAAHRVRSGDRLEISPPDPVASPLEPEAIPLSILHEDADLVVVDKPAGMVVHPSPGHPRGTLVNALLHHCGGLAGIGGVLRPGIVHRLDRGTSGALVAAKSDAAHQALAEQFRDHSVERIYLAVVRGVPRAEEGSVDRPIGRHRIDRKRMSVQTAAGREARTTWRVAGLPILGDPVYGRGRLHPGLCRPALHAALLGFRHPRTGECLRFEAPLPADLATVIRELEAREP
jgi:23S rRNA pseudouridine1911/1915/1917 synthase